MQLILLYPLKVFTPSMHTLQCRIQDYREGCALERAKRVTVGGMGDLSPNKIF